MNTFLSTTTQSNVALIYSGNGESRPLFESVLFEIEIEQSYSTEPFTDICPVSFFRNEHEVLFTIGCIFRINSIYDLTPTIWIINLSLVTYNDKDVAEKCFMDVQQIALATSPCNHRILVRFYESMALLQIEKNNYTIALELLSKVLQIALDYSFASNIIIHTYSNLGLVYRKILNFDRACENYELALNIITQSNALPKLHPLHSVIHNNLAYTKQLQNDYDEAL
ncbi:unnamed protein product [Rotaria sordida]|uniref:Uncharacterized protein n=1 Tax=Rotaria sordida TaxID=392033 RepID=A0A814U0S3_9BILA|nr:unnamed protein product [Rotaria sordida]CAF1419183.1 unnamed protein product [Rotaria sordida]